MVKTSPSNAVGAGPIPDRGARIPHALRPKNQNIKQKAYCNKFNKDFKNSPHQKNLKKKKKTVNFRSSFLKNLIKTLLLYRQFLILRVTLGTHNPPPSPF